MWLFLLSSFLAVFVSLLIVLVISAVISYYRRPTLATTRRLLNNAHVMITGGSSGIGLELAMLCAGLGAKVTIIARNEEKLRQAKDKILSNAGSYINFNGQKYQSSPERFVESLSADVTKTNDIEAAVTTAVSKFGTVDWLFCCTGTGPAYLFLDTPLGEFERLIQLNYLGTVYTTRAVVNNFLQSKTPDKHCRIALMSSLAGLLGVPGYSAYGPAKSALRNFAEVLQFELRPAGVQMSIVFPADTDTEGYREELKMMPKLTNELSEGAGLFTAEAVAQASLSGVVRGQFLVPIVRIPDGLDGFFLTTACSGFAPYGSVWTELIPQVLLVGILRLGAAFYQILFNRAVQRDWNRRIQSN